MDDVNNDTGDVDIPQSGGVYGGLDASVDRNSFTKEDAIKVFQKAIEDLQAGHSAAETVTKILDTAFDILPLII
jgi:hypothetical protein